MPTPDASDRYTVISADTHAGAWTREYRPYVDPAFRADFDDYLVELETITRETNARIRRTLEHWGGDEDGTAGDAFFAVLEAGIHDASARVKALEQDGCVGSVLFPGAHHAALPPFGVNGYAQTGKYSRAQRQAGARAYNRWLADYCSEYPDQLAGVVIVADFYEVDDVVAEIEWGAEHGLRGGLLLPSTNIDLPDVHDAYYDPIWAALAATGLPINIHGGEAVDVRTYGDTPAAYGLSRIEADFFNKRPLWLLMLTGAFDRHPGLKLVLSEQSSGWIPGELAKLERGFFEMPHLEDVRNMLKRTPREYWAENCAVGATFMAPSEARKRHEIGLDTIMWGTDFPHPEGTYPHTTENMRRSFHDVPEDDLRAIFARNAARVYGFDLERLAPIAARVGPSVEEIAQPLVDEPPGFRRWAIGPHA